nr:hypothetical protein [Tanacetum cinerariifolium]
MVRDSVQLETTVNTISHEYLLEFTSEYGISEMLHPELPGPGDRIVDFPEGKDAREWYLFCGGCEGAGYASYPYPKTIGDVTVLGRYKSQYYLGDEVNEPVQFDTCPKSDKATDSSGVPSTIERSPLDFDHEAEASGRETVDPEMPPPEHIPITTAPGTDQAVETDAVEPPVVRESRKRGHEGTDANASPKSLRRDHADLRPSGSSRGEKSLAAMQLSLASNVFVSEGVPADVSDPDPLAFADALSPHPADVAQFEQEAKLLQKSVAQVARRDQRIQARESEIKNLEALLETEAGMKRAAKEKSTGLSQELERMPGVAKGMSEGLKHGVEHGCAQLMIESLEAYDPEAEAKFAAALQSLKDLKYPLLDQLEGLKDAPMDVIMAALYLESDTGRCPTIYTRPPPQLLSAHHPGISRGARPPEPLGMQGRDWIGGCYCGKHQSC